MSGWRPDALLPGFESLELAQPDDYEGAVVATLVRLPAGDAPRGPVLYVHGWADYFFQRHMAERFNAEGFAFHALELRKYGRSLRSHQHPNFCKDLREYDADLTAALDALGGPVLLAGHSTGGLICALYASDGARKERIRGLWLNSAFFDFRAHGWQRTRMHLAAAAGRFVPFIPVPEELPPHYVRALQEEWEFDLRLKPLRGFPIYFGWIGAITDAHARVHRGLAIDCPVLSMHGDEADIILDWRDIARWSRMLGPRVSVLAFPGGWHDLVLSPRGIREEVFSALFAWAERIEA